MESTENLWLNFFQLEVLNKINHQYLTNENVDKKLVEAWLDNKIRREGHGDHSKPTHSLQSTSDTSEERGGQKASAINKWLKKVPSSKLNIR